MHGRIVYAFGRSHQWIINPRFVRMSKRRALFALLPNISNVHDCTMNFAQNKATCIHKELKTEVWSKYIDLSSRDKLGQALYLFIYLLLLNKIKLKK